MALALPEDIIREEILTRLPVISLVRFRSVCKLWSSLLFDPRFILSILNRGITQDPNDDDYLILINTCRRPTFDYGLSILSRNNLSETRMDKLPNPFTHVRPVHLVGSINGLVCMACSHGYDYHFVLWNPATGLWKTILTPRYFYVYGKYVHLHGFGWDSVENDYKLISKTRYNRKDYVYSSKTDSWSLKEGWDSDSRSCQKDIGLSPSVIVKGIPYWKLVTDQIIKFEVRNNTFTNLNLGIRRRLDLLNLNDCLGVIEHSSFGSVVSRFNEESKVLTKMYTTVTAIDDYSLPICFKYGGEIVFIERNILYDPKSGEIKILGHPRDYRHTFGGFSYTPSLLALEGMKPLHSSDPKR